MPPIAAPISATRNQTSRASIESLDGPEDADMLGTLAHEHEADVKSRFITASSLRPMLGLKSCRGYNVKSRKNANGKFDF